MTETDIQAVMSVLRKWFAGHVPSGELLEKFKKELHEAVREANSD